VPPRKFWEYCHCKWCISPSQFNYCLILAYTNRNSNFRPTRHVVVFGLRIVNRPQSLTVERVQLDTLSIYPIVVSETATRPSSRVVGFKEARINLCILVRRRMTTVYDNANHFLLMCRIYRNCQTLRLYL